MNDINLLMAWNLFWNGRVEIHCNVYNVHVLMDQCCVVANIFLCANYSCMYVNSITCTVLVELTGLSQPNFNMQSQIRLLCSNIFVLLSLSASCCLKNHNFNTRMTNIFIFLKWNIWIRFASVLCSIPILKEPCNTARETLCLNITSFRRI